MNNQVNQYTKPKGLLNVGATCYMNAVLQCFYHVKILTNELLKYKNFPSNSISLAYYDVIYKLSFCSKNAADPTLFKNAISSNPLFSGIQANDSKDLILYFFETIDRELTLLNYFCQNTKYINRIREMKNYQNKELMNIIYSFDNCHKSIISDLFYGFTYNKMTCKRCKEDLVNYQIFNLLFFPIEAVYNFCKEKNPQRNANTYNSRPTTNNIYGNFYNGYSGYSHGTNSNKKVNIYDCFDYEKTDVTFTGDNKIYCNKCKTLNDSLGNSKIYSSPHILILILDRGKGNQFECEVEFNETLNIRKYVERNDDCPVEYNLIGIISHLGESNMNGHFIADCKHFDNKWYTFNDSIVSGPYASFQKHGTPYILFYQNSKI
jgi:ubiquitin C-terminal hydrolase